MRENIFMITDSSDKKHLTLEQGEYIQSFMTMEEYVITMHNCPDTFAWRIAEVLKNYDRKNQEINIYIEKYVYAPTILLAIAEVVYTMNLMIPISVYVYKKAKGQKHIYTHVRSYGFCRHWDYDKECYVEVIQ